MRIGVKGFRGMAPRLAPHELPPNGAQLAINARLQSGDLEAWRQFLETERLAEPPMTIYLLNDRWLSWGTDVDVARAPIPGDDTFRVYLTGPDEYDTPRWTNYSLAFQSPGGAAPVVTRPIGVPAHGSAPTLDVGVSSNPDTFSIDTQDDNASLATSWATNPELNSAGRVAIVDQQSGYYRVRYDENRDPGQEAYAYRNFGVAGVSVLQVSAHFEFNGDLGVRQAGMIVGAQLTGAGVGAVYEDGILYIRKPSAWGVHFNTAVLSQVAVVPALSGGVTYTMRVNVVTNTDGTKTVTAELFDAAGTTELATLTATNNFEDGDYCGFANGAIADAATVYQTDYSDFHVQASGSTNATVVNVATSYVFTMVNDLGEESAPSPPSATILRPDGVSVTVTTPVGAPTGTSSDYGIESKRIYRAVTGATGSIFRLVAEIPLATADYVDTLTDAELGEELESEGWDLPPDDLQGVLALPNGIMCGFRRNQLCFSAQNRPHAWPVAYRLNTDTDIVGIGAIDTAVIVGTQSFPYVAQGQTPADYAAAKLEVPQACVSKRSIAYLSGVGVCMATPDGYMAISGVVQPVNLTRGVFTREQWQALDPTTIVGVAHDDVLHFWYGSYEFQPVESASTWDSTNEFADGQWTYAASNSVTTYIGVGGVGQVVNTQDQSTGKRYFEIVFDFTSSFSNSVRHDVGITALSPVAGGMGGTPSAGYRRGGGIVKNGGVTTAAPAITDLAVVMCAVDLDTGRVWFGTNGTWAGSGDPANNLNPAVVGMPAASYKIGGQCESGTHPTTFTLRTTEATFSYAVPDGFQSWGTSGEVIVGSGAGYAMDAKLDGFGLIQLGYHASAVHADPISDNLYLALDAVDEPTSPYLPEPSTAPVPDGQTIYQFDADPDNLMTYLWRGRLNLLEQPFAPQFQRVLAADFDNLMARGYQDETMQFESVVVSSREFRSRRSDLAEVSYVQELIGTSRVRGMLSAEDIDELGG